MGRGGRCCESGVSLPPCHARQEGRRSFDVAAVFQHPLGTRRGFPFLLSHPPLSTPLAGSSWYSNSLNPTFLFLSAFFFFMAVNKRADKSVRGGRVYRGHSFRGHSFSYPQLIPVSALMHWEGEGSPNPVLSPLSFLALAFGQHLIPRPQQVLLCVTDLRCLFLSSCLSKAGRMRKHRLSNSNR